MSSESSCVSSTTESQPEDPWVRSTSRSPLPSAGFCSTSSSKDLKQGEHRLFKNLKKAKNYKINKKLFNFVFPGKNNLNAREKSKILKCNMCTNKSEKLRSRTKSENPRNKVDTGKRKSNRSHSKSEYFAQKELLDIPETYSSRISQKKLVSMQSIDPSNTQSL